MHVSKGVQVIAPIGASMGWGNPLRLISYVEVVILRFPGKIDGEAISDLPHFFNSYCTDFTAKTGGEAK